MNDLTGLKFGRLKVLRESGSTKHKKKLWVCACDCGKETIVIGSGMISGNTSSCGCHHKEIISTQFLIHGHNTINSISSEYVAWGSMKNRCLNKNNKAYKNYGGRGIKICDRWLSFENFIADMKEKPSSEYSIERNDVDGNYEPSNCRWATKTEQSRNQRAQNKNITGVRGVTWRKRTNNYFVRIGVDSKTINIGYTDSLEEAKRMRAEAELKYWKKSS